MTTPRVSYLSDARQVATSLNIALKKIDALGLSADQTTVTLSRPIDIAGVVKISGIQVVGPQQAAIANTTGATLAALETEVNKLKAALRTAGMIAP